MKKLKSIFKRFLSFHACTCFLIKIHRRRRKSKWVVPPCLQPFVMSSAVCMVGSVTMVCESSGAPLMQVTHARTALHWCLASLYVGMFLPRMHLDNTVPQASPAYCNNSRQLLSCPTTTVWCQVEGPYLVLLTMVIVLLPPSVWHAGYVSFPVSFPLEWS